MAEHNERQRRGICSTGEIKFSYKPSMSSKKISIVVIVVGVAVAVAIAVTVYFSRNAALQNNPGAVAEKPPTTPVGSLIEPAAPNQQTVNVTITATDGKFSPANITVPVGARVLLTFVNLGTEYHNLTIMGKYLQTATPTIAPGQ